MTQSGLHPNNLGLVAAHKGWMSADQLWPQLGTAVLRCDHPHVMMDHWKQH